MNSIESYLNSIYNDFEKYTKNEENLCELKSLSYKNACIPDYRNIRVQQLYLLRYAYAYSYEYTEIYRQVLQRMGRQKELSVVSVGCGTLIDYWSLAQALSYYRQSDCIVNYVGMDAVEWNYRFSKRAQDNVQTYLHNNAVDCFIKNPQFVSDIYFFPKSISEFSLQEIQQIADCFEKKPIEKDKFFICVSLRNSEENRRPILKTEQICYQIIPFERRMAA